jgi:hypothetical protein
MEQALKILKIVKNLVKLKYTRQDLSNMKGRCKTVVEEQKKTCEF